jgi:hypothetical protein
MMKYFAEFPKILYNFNITGENRLVVVRDIALNVRFVQELVEGIDFYNEYDIEDGETPQFIAEKVYKDPLLHWVIMVYNQRYDYFYDWPMDSDTLDAYITEKYGSGNENDQHIIFGNPHYEDANGNIFYKVNTQTGADDSTSVPYAKVISNKDYEYKVNNSKRRIKLIDIRLINQVVDEFQSAFEVIQR